MTYWRLYYHLVWSTKNRLPVIDERTEEILMRTLPGITQDVGCFSHAVGIMPEHVHIALSIPPRLAISRVVNSIKVSSSQLLTHDLKDEVPSWPGWQHEYGIVSFSEHSLQKIVAYVTHQREHHAASTLIPGLEREERERTSAVP